jgi:hypothetical protein
LGRALDAVIRRSARAVPHHSRAARSVAAAHLRTRRIRLLFASACPYQKLFGAMLRRSTSAPKNTRHARTVKSPGWTGLRAP